MDVKEEFPPIPSAQEAAAIHPVEAVTDESPTQPPTTPSAQEATVIHPVEAVTDESSTQHPTEAVTDDMSSTKPPPTPSTQEAATIHHAEAVIDESSTPSPPIPSAQVASVVIHPVEDVTVEASTQPPPAPTHDQLLEMFCVSSQLEQTLKQQVELAKIKVKVSTMQLANTETQLAQASHDRRRLYTQLNPDDTASAVDEEADRGLNVKAQSNPKHRRRPFQGKTGKRVLSSMPQTKKILRRQSLQTRNRRRISTMMLFKSTLRAWIVLKE